jgi:hypothetical protein
MKKPTPRKQPIYYFEKLQKKDSTLIFDEQGNVTIYTRELHHKVCNAIYSWRNNPKFKKRIKTKIKAQKSKEFDDVANEWYYALRVVRVK